MAAKEGSASAAGGRPAQVCSRCKLTHSAGCRHCFCTGEYCDHEDQLCEAMLSAACNGNICFGCRQRTKKVKLEEKLRSAAPPTPEPSPARRSIRARVDEATAIIRNKDMTAYCTFLDPLRTSTERRRSPLVVRVARCSPSRRRPIKRRCCVSLDGWRRPTGQWSAIPSRS